MPADKKKKIFGAKMFLLVALIVLVLGAMGAVIYYVSKNYRQLEDFNEAVSAFNSQDWELAEKKLMAAIAADPNNEDVVSKLATVNEKLGNWTEAGLFWSRAAELNAFKPEYAEQAANAFFRSGDVQLLQEELRSAQPFKTDRQRLLMAFVYAQSEQVAAAQKMIDELASSESAATELGKLVSLLIEESPERTPEARASFEALAQAEDPAIALYALYTLANDAIGRGEMLKAQEYLERRMPLNSKLATISLANFYYIQGKSQEAAALYREQVDELTPIESIRYAESLIALKEVEALQELAKRYRVGRRADILTGYYMDALLAYEAGDGATVSAKLEALGDELPVTPVAQMLSVYDAVQRKDAKEIINLLKAFPYDAHERLATYVTLIRPLVLELMTQNNLTEAAQIAELLNIRNFEDVIFTLAQIGNAAQKQLLSRIDLDQALEAYPEEPRLWSIAADFHLRNENYLEAQQASQRLLKLIPGSISGQLQNIAALESLKQIDQAATTFEALYHAHPTDRRVLIQYLAFCSRNQLATNLSDLLNALKDHSEHSPAGATMLAEAELAQLAGDREKLHSVLIQVAEDPQLVANSENAAILYRTAHMLATNDYEAPAIKVYRKLLPLAPNSVPVLVNLSELYATLAEQNSDDSAAQEALKLAQQAYTAAPESAIARECYAIRLHESGAHEEAQKLLLNLIQQGAESARIRDAWKGSMEQMIQALAAKNEIYNRSNLCQALLNEFPNNPIATQNLQAIQLELQRRATEAKDATKEASQ
ncbi:hypothetical protein SH580_03820 [Coraliomargarita algicola]|uniref:Tetratricopeptide repeat protein n=1 Tax=Coraliomargarita algicola TaxID=3092156 RepID=A0ABZ0RPK7_9BACT|nr:hypothetical protein [Coraliomargarita sp. J2-16]WPJ96832.1 hypothetical protein SH580_03820 [Coraliomargarita sp. J2-16]